MTTATIARLPQINPATLETVAEFDAAAPVDVQRAVSAARRAFRGWSETPIRERARILSRLRPLLAERAGEIAVAVTKSTGKPLVEAYSSELFSVAYLVEYFLKYGPKMLRPQKVALPMMKWGGRKSTIEFRPVGVVGIISPWNYPFSIPMGEAVIALLAGCTVVLKPSEATPLVGQVVADLFRDAGLPEGVFQVVQGPGAIGQALIDARPDKIVFTGGTETGRRIMAAAAKHLIPVVLELGGKDPMIVCEDANLDRAVDAAVWGCFTNSGQVCASVKRIFVHEKIADAFTEAVVRKTKALRMGNPMDPDVDVGSLTTRPQFERIEAQVESAVREGAALAAGGRARPELGGLHFEPTVFTNVSPAMRVAREEIFGPVLPILRVPDEDEAVRLANDSSFGLTASVWSRDLRRARALARRIEAGTVTVNDATYTHALCETPWGGVKDSGFGRTHGSTGLLEFVIPFHLNVNESGFRSLWWFPYDRSALEVFRAGVRFACARGFGKFRPFREMLRHLDFGKLK
jgi:succinate-semialdehyde dehydrogenase/glutarate-semialdehyde dehydrogenase